MATRVVALLATRLAFDSQNEQFTVVDGPRRGMAIGLPGPMRSLLVPLILISACSADALDSTDDDGSESGKADGTLAWRRETPATSGAIDAVWGASDGRYFALGREGTGHQGSRETCSKGNCEEDGDKNGGQGACEKSARQEIRRP